MGKLVDPVSKKMHSKDVDGLWRFLRHMPKSDDLALIVLKGHLLVEEELNEIRAIKFSEPEALFSARLSFSQRLAVLKALVGSGKDSSFCFSAIEQLNGLRNQLAHNLEPKELEQRVEKFLSELEEAGLESEFAKEKGTVRLKRCIALLCGRLSGYQQAFKSLQILRQKEAKG